MRAISNGSAIALACVTLLSGCSTNPNFGGPSKPPYIGQSEREFLSEGCFQPLYGGRSVELLHQNQSQSGVYRRYKCGLGNLQYVDVTVQSGAVTSIDGPYQQY